MTVYKNGKPVVALATCVRCGRTNDVWFTVSEEGDVCPACIGATGAPVHASVHIASAASVNAVPTLTETQLDIKEECDRIAEMLIAKNRAYGDSALDPVRVFSRASTVEQLLVRIDDKLSRLARGSAAGEDVERDLLGYLVLLAIARRRATEVES